MNYPKEVQDKIDLLDTYKINNNLTFFDIIHMYPDNEVAYPIGFYDSRFFVCIGFNTDKKEKRDLGRHDGIQSKFNTSPLPLNMSRIFADGSTLLKFSKFVNLVDNGQCIFFESTYIAPR